jgi:hypothetical protein
MKKLITTLLCILYLISSVGYSSIEHYCLLMHPQKEDAATCCCASDQEDMSSSTPPDMSHGSCSAHLQHSAASPSVAHNATAIAAGKCCKTTSSYHQLDDSTTRESTMHSALAPHLFVETILPKVNSFIQNANIPLFTDPSFQLNLPLLI